MSGKTMVTIGMIIGSIVGGYIPSFFGAGILSYWGLLGSFLGATFGIYISYQLTK